MGCIFNVSELTEATQWLNSSAEFRTKLIRVHVAAKAISNPKLTCHNNIS